MEGVVEQDFHGNFGVNITCLLPSYISKKVI